MTAEDLYADRLTPARVLIRRDLEFATSRRHDLRRDRSDKCFICVVTSFAILSISVLVFALVVLHIKSPDLEIASVTMTRVRYGSASSPSLNASLVAVLTIDNSNFGFFSFESSLVYVQYEGVNVGRGKIGRGRVDVQRTTTMNVNLDVRLKDPWQKLKHDIDSGSVLLTSYARLKGTMNMIKILTRRRTAAMNCTITINLPSSSIDNVSC